MKIINKLAGYVKHHKKRIVVLIIVVVIVGFIFRPKSAVPAPTQIIKSGDIKQTVSATGNVAAKRSVNLIFQVPGKVTYAGVKKGDFVNAYQTIASIDQRTVQKNLENALLDYSKQRNTFEQNKDDNNAEKIDDAMTEKIKRILQNSQYDLNKAVISVELQDLVKQESYLVTPIAGIVSRADIETPGLIANASTTYTVVDPESVVFNMDVDEADVAKIVSGQSVKVSLDAYPDDPLDLSVSDIDFVSHTTSTGGTAYTVEAVLGPNENYQYRIGMSGEGEILIHQKSEVLVVPLVAVFNDNHVYVKNKKGYEDRKVTLGLQNDTDVEVISGLRPGDEVVLTPNSITEPQKK